MHSFLEWAVNIYLIDRWTLVHVAYFFFLSILLWWCTGVCRLGPLLLFALILGLSWEILESRIEGLWGPYGEPAWNRWISDPFADVLGAILAWTILRKRHRGSI